MKASWILVPAVMLLMTVPTPVVIAEIAEPGEVQRGGRRVLDWVPSPTEYLYFEPVVQEKIEPRVKPADEKHAVAPYLSYLHFMGYEVNARGEFRNEATPLVLEEFLMQLAMYTVEGKKKEGDKWMRQWQFERVQSSPTGTVNSEYTLGADVRYEGSECAVITGTHKTPTLAADTPAPFWVSFDLTTTAYFDYENQRLKGAILELHALRRNLAAVNTEPTTDHLSWKIEYRLRRATETTADRDLMGKVEQAIAKGVERLWALENKTDGGWPYSTHKRGGTALSLLALLICGVDAKDERIARNFDLLKTTELANTYDVAVSIMAYEARYITDAEKRAFLSEEDPGEMKRELTAEDRAEMQRLVDWLVANQNQPNPFWNYSRDGTSEATAARYDMSVTQYALLGFAAAIRCGIRIPTGIVKRLVEEVMKIQSANGPKFNRVVGFKPPKNPKDDAKTTRSSKPIEARGWAYANKATYDAAKGTGTAYGSMTTAGLTCLIVGLDIANSMNQQDFNAEFGGKQGYTRWELQVKESLEAGFAWLEYWFSVTRNPNYGRTWYLYYLYGLERVCMMAEIKHLGVNHWYNQGASALVVLQDSSGGWGSAPDTCFALLFLKKGTVRLKKPVYTGNK